MVSVKEKKESKEGRKECVVGMWGGGYPFTQSCGEGLLMRWWLTRGLREAACRTSGGLVEAASSEGTQGTSKEPRSPERVEQTSPGLGAPRGAELRWRRESGWWSLCRGSGHQKGCRACPLRSCWTVSEQRTDMVRPTADSVILVKFTVETWKCSQIKNNSLQHNIPFI